MENFNYVNPTNIEFGKDKEKLIGKYLKDYNIKKVLICYGSDRIKKDGLFDIVANSLKEQNIKYVECGRIVSNPILSKVNEGIKIAKENEVDGVLSIGGGSVLDSTKAIAVGSMYDGDVWDFFIGKEIINSALPIFDILTLSATGSEMNGFSVVTNEDTKQKYSIASTHIYPKVSIINPVFMQTISKDYLVYSASDVIAHTIEGYFTSTTQPIIISRQIEAIIKTIIETTETLIENPKDYSARGEFSWCATLALNGQTYVGCAGFSYPNHMIEHSLSALYNIPHGAGLSIIIPAWMKWYYKKNEQQFIRFAKEIFNQSSAFDGISSLEKWFDKIGTPTRLSHVNIKESDIDTIVENAKDNAMHFGISEIYTKEILKEILTLAL